MEIFQKTQEFDDRATKSIFLESKFSDGGIFDKGGPVNFQFVLFKRGDEGGLDITPTKKKDLLESKNTTVVDFELTADPRSSRDDFLSNIRKAINDEMPTRDDNGEKLFNVCAMTDCRFACPNPSEENCEEKNKTNDIVCTDASCDVVIDQKIKNGNFFISTVAYTITGNTLTKKSDIDLIGLYTVAATINPNMVPPKLKLDVLDVPVHPPLIPRFRNIVEFQGLINKAVKKSVGGSNVGVVINYVPRDADAGTAARLSATVEIGYGRSFDFGFDTSLAIGDLTTIEVVGDDLENPPKFNTAIDVQLESTVGVTLGPSKDEQIILVANGCDPTCNAPAIYIGVKYQEDGDDEWKTLPGGEIISLDVGNPLDRLQTSQLNSITKELFQLDDAPLIIIKFLPKISRVKITIPKCCDGGSELKQECPPNTKEIGGSELKQECPPNTEVIEYPNYMYYFKTDQEMSKKPFQVGMGNTTIDAGFTIKADATITANVGEVIEVEAGLSANLTGDLSLNITVPKTDELLPFQDWIVAITKVNHTDSVGHISDFFRANATFTGGVNASISLKEPFSLSGDPFTVNGTLDEYTIKFRGDPFLNRPKFTLEPKFPNIGNVSKLSFDDVLDVLEIALEFLIGDPEESSVQSCDAGLLGLEVFGKNIFAERLPGKTSIE